MRHRRIGLPLSLLIVAAVMTGCTAAPPPPTASPTPTPSATPTPTAEAAPKRQDVRVTSAAGSIAKWKTASVRSVGEVGPAVGLASEGTVAAMADAPVVSSKGTTLLTTEVALKPSATYTFRAQVHPLTETLDARAITAVVGTQKVSSPELPVSRWTEVTGTITTDAADSAAAKKSTLKITLSTPARRVLIDDVSLVASDGSDLVKNGSFEKVSPKALVDNTSLIMSSDYATIAVAAPAGPVSWKVTRPGGKVAGEGTVTAAKTLEAIPLVGVPQGFYTLTVKDAKGRTATTPIGLVDTPAYDIPLDPRFGTTIHVKQEGSLGQARYAAMLGIGTVRSDVLWRLNELSRGKYTWDERYESEFARARASGVGLSAIVNYGNQVWGNPKVPNGATEIAAYGRYAGAIASHYKPTSIEVFNEFNQERFNKGACGVSADCYLPLLKSVHDNVRSVDSEITLIGGATANYPSSWFDRLWSIGGLKYVDAMSFHPYQSNSHPETVAKLISNAHNVSAKHDDGAVLPVWITETGSSSKTGGRTLPSQGQFLLRIESSELAGGAVSTMWYDLKNTTANAGDHEGNFGLYEFTPRANVASIALKPAGYDQALLIAAVNGRGKPTTADAGAKNIVAQSFGDGDRAVYVVWTSNSKKATAALPTEKPMEVVSWDGTTKTVEPADGEVSVPATGTAVIVRPKKPDVDPAITTSPLN